MPHVFFCHSLGKNRPPCFWNVYRRCLETRFQRDADPRGEASVQERPGPLEAEAPGHGQPDTQRRDQESRRGKEPGGVLLNVER